MWVYDLVRNKSFIYACLQGRLNIVQWLYRLQLYNIEYIESLGSDKYQIYSWGPNTISFIEACGTGQLDIAKWMYNLDPDIVNAVALSYACKNGHLDVVEWICSLEHDIVSSDSINEACMYNHLDILKILYMYNPSAFNSWTYIIARYHKYLNIIEWLWKLGIPDITHLVFTDACCTGNLDIAKSIYQLYSNFIDKNNRGLIYACVNNRIDIVKWLIDVHLATGFIYFSWYDEYTLEIKNLLIDNNLVHPSQLNDADLEHYLNRTNRIVPADFDYPNTIKRGKRTKPALRTY